MKRFKFLVSCLFVVSIIISISALSTASVLTDFSDAFLPENQSKWVTGTNVDHYEGSIANATWEGNELIAELTEQGSLTYDVPEVNEFDIEFMLKYDEGSENDQWGLGLTMILRGTPNPGLDDVLTMFYVGNGAIINSYGPGWYSQWDSAEFFVDPDELNYDRNEWNKYRITVKTNAADSDMVDLSVSINDVLLAEETIESNPTDSGKVQFFVPQPGANVNFRIKAVPLEETVTEPTGDTTQETTAPGDFNKIAVYLTLAVVFFAVIMVTKKKEFSK